MDPVQHVSTSDEINLRDLFCALWRGKWLIISSIVVGILLATAYLFKTTERWTSESAFVRPSIISMGTYMQKQIAYFRLGNMEFTPTREEDIKNNAFNTFLLTVSSTDVQEKLLSETTLFKNSTKEMSDQNKVSFLNALISRDLKIDAGDQSDPAEKRISFTATTPIDAQATLKTFLELANLETLRALEVNLNETIKNRVLLLRQMAESLKTSTDQKKANRIAELRQARDSAAQAKIDKMFNRPGQGNNRPDTIIDFKNPETLFLLGEQNLTAQLRSLEQSPAIYPAAYYSYLNDAKQLEALLATSSKGTMIDVTKAPTLPLFRDSPKRAVSLILGVIAGLFIGIFIVLLRFSATRQNKGS